MQSVGIEPTLLRTRALSVRLNRSAKTASIVCWVAETIYECLGLGCIPRTTSWRNGNASDSRPEDWGFDSLWGHLTFCFFFFFLVFLLVCFHVTAVGWIVT